MKRLIMFDFDGTLADTSPGILACHRYALMECGKAIPAETTLRKIIGAPLRSSYIESFGFDEVNARIAVRAYRERYAKFGIYEVVPYEGIHEVLIILKKRGFMLGIATLKAHRFLSPMISNLGFEGIFDVWHGMDDQDGLTKADLICNCLNDLRVTPCDAVIVGDSVHDELGAKAAGVGFIGVSYGFGFKPHEVSCHEPKDIINYL